MEQLNVLLRIFFVSDVFQNFDVDFWRKKCFPWSNFEGNNFFLQNFIFYHPYESINLRPAGLLKIALIVTPLIEDLKEYWWIYFLMKITTFYRRRSRIHDKGTFFINIQNTGRWNYFALGRRRVPIYWLGSYSTLLMFIAHHIYISWNKDKIR